jgi:predicted NBD/HSP70 family sugar kinase
VNKPKVVYSIDIGDVYMRGGFFVDGTTREVIRVSTPHASKGHSGEENLWTGVKALVERIQTEAPPMEALSVSASGIMTLRSAPGAREFGPFKDLELYVLAPNVDGLKYVPIMQRLESLNLGVPVHVENDVNAATISITAYDDAVCVNLGGGLGAAAKSKGQIQHVKGTWSCYEVGHGMRWDLPEHLTRLCHCGNNGCLEAAIGGWAMTERYGYLPELAPADVYGRMREDVVELLPHAIVSVVRQSGVNRVLLAGKGSVGYQESDSAFISRIGEHVGRIDNSLKSMDISMIELTETAEMQGSALALLSYFEN